MEDYDRDIVSLLRTITPNVVDAYFTNDRTPIPCISYNNSYDSDYAVGDTIEYANHEYLIKIYDYDYSNVLNLKAQVLNLMHDNGFHCISSNKSKEGRLNCCIMRFEGLFFNKK